MKNKRYNIILDLDETLINSLDKDEHSKDYIKQFKKHFKSREMSKDFTVFERPNLQTFLDFLFENFNVSVWTAASKSYALFIIDKFILKKQKPDRKLDYIFCSYHCDLSYEYKNASKDLSMLWEKFGLKQFNKNNTLIIDDNLEVYNTQPKNCIRIKAFKVHNKTCLDDKILVNKIKKKLLKL